VPQKKKVVEIRFYEELNDFLPLEKHKITFHHPFSGNPTIKDLIESLRVPHTEIDLIIVNGNSVDFSYAVQDHDKISVYPTFESLDITPIIKLRPEPLRDPKFILDVHLGKLAKYLRLLGFNVLYDNHYDDKNIIEIAKSQHRIILTRDIGILKNKTVTHGYWVRNIDWKEQVAEILTRFELFSKIAPFTRCLECNGVLEPIEKSKIEDQLPPKTKKFYQRYAKCPECNRIYWEGTHYEKMKKFVGDTGSCLNS